MRVHSAATKIFLQLENFGAALFIANVSQYVQKVKKSGFGKTKLKTNSEVFVLLHPVCLGDISRIYVLNPKSGKGFFPRRCWGTGQALQGMVTFPRLPEPQES